MEGLAVIEESEGQMQQAESRRTPIGPVLAVVGGALLVVGSFLAWAKVSGGGVSVSAKGIDGSDGWVTVIAGAVALAVGIAAMRGPRRALAILAILAGLAGGGLGVYDALTAKDSVLDAAAEEIAPGFGATPEEVRGLLDDAIDAGQLEISLSIGLYIVIAGGALALVGGALQLGGGSQAPSMPGAFTADAVPASAPPSAPPSGFAAPEVAPPPAPPAPPASPPPPEAPSP
jgi:hypothetical protein